MHVYKCSSGEAEQRFCACINVQIVQTEMPLAARSQSPALPVPQPLPELQSRGVSAPAEQDMPDGLPSLVDTVERNVTEVTSCVLKGTLNSSHLASRTVIWRRRPDGSEQRLTR